MCGWRRKKSAYALLTPICLMKFFRRSPARWALIFGAAFFSTAAPATILWQASSQMLAHENGTGADVLRGAVHRTGTASDTLYFKFHMDPLSDVGTEEYLAGLQFFENDTEKFGVGNSLKAYGYSAFNTAEQGANNNVFGDVDLRSGSPEAFEAGKIVTYELPRRGQSRTLVFKVQYVPGGDDNVTVWMNPDLTPGATEENQPETLTTHFKANGKFTAVHLRHNGNGGGWYFSELEIATSFNDLIVPRFWQRLWFDGLLLLFLFAAAIATVRLVEKKKFQRRLQRAEQERALEQERSRIAQDLHDDLGSLLTRISLLGGLLKADKDSPEQTEAHAAKISQAADQTVRALEEIVWAVRPGSDSLQSLVEYIAHFATELFEEGSTRCRLDLPAEVPARPLPPDVRHNIFLIAKESLTNALKHANGSTVHLQVKTDGRTFKMIVADDGNGFDVGIMSANGHRNGLENMRRRAETVGGCLGVTSAPGQGSRVEFELNFSTAK
jgi:signal transduction histidine kinase